MVITIRAKKIWILSASVRNSYLQELENLRLDVRRVKLPTKLEVMLHGPWDITTEEGRECYWQQMACEFSRFSRMVKMSFPEYRSIGEREESDESGNNSPC
jgi:hypothetical protein